MRMTVVTTLVLCLIACRPCAAASSAQRKAAAERAKAAWSPDVKAAFGFEKEGSWSGGTFVSSPRKGGEKALRWEKHTKTGGVRCVNAPRDLSAFNVMSFWLHSSHANGATFYIIAESRREKATFSYYARKVTVDWTGWKRLEFRFRDFGKTRSPAGWDKIDVIRFTASGWNQEPTDQSVWVLDELDFSFDDRPYRPSVNVKKYVNEPAKGEFLARLRRGHPRLIVLDEDLERIKRFIADDPRGAQWYENTKKRAQSHYRRGPRTHVLSDGRRLLGVSRDVLDRLYHWCFMYRMEKDRKWLDRAWREMEAVAAFKDWNPSHYLDTAEMMHAFAIGYDWLYNDLTPEQRRTIRTGLWRLGLGLSHATYMGEDMPFGRWWMTATNNWNFVCQGGTSLAAMAVLDEMPEECGDVLHAAFQLIQIPLHHFEPDGAWWEGMGYWGYSMRYLLSYLRGLETAFGTDFGFVESLRDKGFSRAGDFPVYLVSPQGGIYNFADSGSGGGVFQHWALYYLAQRFENPLYQHFQLERTRGGLYDLVYYRPLEGDVAVQDMALDKHFRVTEVATMRSSWTDRNALFAGVKCGKNGIAHAHQDLGSFIFYGLEEKWLIDPGTESQTYQGHKHHIPGVNFYRIREEGHNTLVFDPEEKVCQDRRGSSKIVRFETSPSDAFAIADLTHAYRKHAASVRRGYMLLGHRRLLMVQDEVRGAKGGDLWWFAHSAPRTEFALRKSGREATLKRNGKTCYAFLLAPEGARFEVMDARPLPTSPNPDIQNKNKDMKKLAVHLTGMKDVTIAALFAPVFDFEPEPKPARAVKPLDEWRIIVPTLPVLAGITVDGNALSDFSPNVFTYTFEVGPDVDRAPSIAASPKDERHTIRTFPATSLPGTARILVNGPGGAASVYTIRFFSERPRFGANTAQRKPKPATVDGVTVTASHYDGNEPKNVLDADLKTRWSAEGEKEWIAFDFGRLRWINMVEIAWFRGNARRASFKVSVSDDGKAWRDVFEGKSSGTTEAIEQYALRDPVVVRHVKITCHGNSDNLWNSITHVGF